MRMKPENYAKLSLPVRGAWVEITICARRKARKSRSLPVRGAWVEIAAVRCFPAATVRRSPCGERGLKFQGAVSDGMASGRSPCGERGLKWLAISEWLEERGRSPCGERGLKW